MQQLSIRARATARQRLPCPALFAAIALLMAGALASPQFAVSAAVAPSVLGTAQSFAVLGGSTVTNTGPTVINGASVGVSPGSAITGFPPGIVTAPGTIHKADAVAKQAQSDVTTAYNTLAGQACGKNLAPELGGLTLTAGVYCQATSQLTGTLMLDAQGDPNAVFVFQVASTLITASNSSVLVINGGSACNVYWQVGSSATLGTNTAFVGNILALTSITVNTGATVAGRALARNGAVTLDNNRFTPSACATTPTSTPTNTPTATPTTTPTNTPTATPATGTPTSTATSTPPQPPAGQPPAGPPPVGQPPAAQPPAGPPPVGQPPAAQPAPAQPVAAQPVAAQPVAARPIPVRPVIVQPVPVQPVVIQPVAAQPAGPDTGSVVAAAPNGQGVTGNAPVSGSTVTGATDTTAPISATLPLVGVPASAAANATPASTAGATAPVASPSTGSTATAAPIPAAMPNTGGGGLATQVTASSTDVNDHRTTGVLWMAIAALVALSGASLLVVRRARR